MDPLDHLGTLPGGARCTVCEEPVPGGRVTILARREDLAVIRVDCHACASTTLGFVSSGMVDRITPSRSAESLVSVDDVLDMHAFLATWHGDLASLLERGA